MAKGWTTIRTDRVNALTKVDAVKQAKTAAKVIGSTKSLNLEDLKKEGVDAHAAAVAREDFILAGQAEGKLQSESLKEEAAAIAKRRESVKARAKNKKSEQ